MNNTKVTIEMMNTYLKQIDSMNDTEKLKYSKVYDALKNTKELLESLISLNEEEAKTYVDTFLSVMSSSLINKQVK